MRVGNLERERIFFSFNEFLSRCLLNGCLLNGCLLNGVFILYMLTFPSTSSHSTLFPFNLTIYYLGAIRDTHIVTYFRLKSSIISINFIFPDIVP